jgi:hypothetical protein
MLNLQIFFSHATLQSCETDNLNSCQTYLYSSECLYTSIKSTPKVISLTELVISSIQVAGL